MENTRAKLVAGAVVKPTGGACGIYESTSCLIGCLGMYDGSKVFLLRSMVKLMGNEKSLNIIQGRQLGWYYDLNLLEYVGTLKELGLTKEDFY